MTRQTLSRIWTIAEMQGRDLARRRLALILLVALPLAFYGSLAGHASDAIVPGGVAMAFSMAGAAIFSVLAARAADQRLVLAGFPPGELLAGRLIFLEALSLPTVAGSSALMALGSSPPRPWILVLAVAMVALVAVPFGLAVAALLPRELEATLVLIGAVGIQLSLDASAGLSKALPFSGPLGSGPPIVAATEMSLVYAAVLFAVSLHVMRRRTRVRRHPPPDMPGAW